MRARCRSPATATSARRPPPSRSQYAADLIHPRGSLAATTLVGTAMLRYVMKIPPLATLSGDELIALLARTVTRYLTADAGELGLPAQSP